MENEIITNRSSFPDLPDFSLSAFVGIDPEAETSPMSGIGDAYGIGAGLTAIFGALPSLGIGTKSRQQEAASAAANNIALAEEEMKAAASKSNSNIKMIAIGGVLLIVGIAVAAVLFTKK
ncbi:MAG: hypothetical protein WCJ95_22650 [Mariniphaga sp.]